MFDLNRIDEELFDSIESSALSCFKELAESALYDTNRDLYDRIRFLTQDPDYDLSIEVRNIDYDIDMIAADPDIDPESYLAVDVVFIAKENTLGQDINIATVYLDPENQDAYKAVSWN